MCVSRENSAKAEMTIFNQLINPYEECTQLFHLFIVFKIPIWAGRRQEILRLQDTFICFGVRTPCSGFLKWFLDLMDKAKTKFINHSSCVVLRNLTKFSFTVSSSALHSLSPVFLLIASHTSCFYSL